METSGFDQEDRLRFAPSCSEPADDPRPLLEFSYRTPYTLLDRLLLKINHLPAKSLEKTAELLVCWCIVAERNLARILLYSASGCFELRFIGHFASQLAFLKACSSLDTKFL
jgi:hypothetical protein